MTSFPSQVPQATERVRERGAMNMSSEEEPPVRVRSREREEVTCSRKAARRAGTLSNWMDDTADEQAFRCGVPLVDLRTILGLCEDDDSSQLASHSVEELIAVMVGANCPTPLAPSVLPPVS